MAAIATLRDVGLAYANKGSTTVVLAGLDLVIEQGEFVAIVGASGVGKSTLLRILAGLSSPSSGTVQVQSERSDTRRPCGLVFQEARLLPWRRILANVELGLEGLALTGAQRRQRAVDALQLVGLSDYARRWPYQLSGGQRQRVGLARALAVQPDLLLMDEPFAALDAITRASLQDELIALWQSQGKTVVFVTHDIDEAVYLADRVIILGGSPASVRKVVAGGPRPRLRATQGLRDSAEAVKQQLDDTWSI